MFLIFLTDRTRVRYETNVFPHHSALNTHSGKKCKRQLKCDLGALGGVSVPAKAPLLELRSDGTTETTALELPVPIPRTVRIVKYFTVYSVATILVLSPPLRCR